MKKNKDIIVYISVLNWNKAQATLNCIESIKQSILPANLALRLFVVDNGSTFNDWTYLSSALKNSDIDLVRNQTNLGFAGGHNVVMQKAIDDNANYVWLVNNDGITLKDTLARLVNSLEKDNTCGAVSPLIVNLEDQKTIEFCGAYHKWHNQMLIPIDNKEITKLDEVNKENLWLIGAAVLFRVSALKQVGLLDDHFFAYFEDNDICARLSFNHWSNKIVFNALFLHDNPNHRQPYFYYLTTRNDFLFWLKNTPKPYRRFIRLRLIERALFRANKLLMNNNTEAANACLLGCLDGFLGKGGQPSLDRKVPFFMNFLRGLAQRYHDKYF